MTRDTVAVVEGFAPTATCDINVRDEVWALALDQRAFGPRRLWIAFADADGRFRGLAYTRRTRPPEFGLAACIAHMGEGAAAAVAFCDAPVSKDPPLDLADRFARARSTAAAYGIRLVDWIDCDDELFRSSQITLHPNQEWWDVRPVLDH